MKFHRLRGGAYLGNGDGFLCCFEHCAWDVVFSHGSAPCGFEPCAWDVAFSHECAPVDIEELHFI